MEKSFTSRQEKIIGIFAAFFAIVMMALIGASDAEAGSLGEMSFSGGDFSAEHIQCTAMSKSLDEPGQTEGRRNSVGNSDAETAI